MADDRTVEAVEAEHKRTIADVIATLEDRAWRRGCIVGFGVGVVVAVVLLYVPMWWS